MRSAVKRLTNVIQIVAVLLAAFFIVCLFTAQFPPWKSDDDGGAGGGRTRLSCPRRAPLRRRGHHCGGRRSDDRSRRGSDDCRGREHRSREDIDGQALYEDQCASCHGKTGGGGFGPSLKGIRDRFSEEEESSTS